MSKADEWMDFYVSFNAEDDQAKKKVLVEDLNKIKYGCFRTLRRVEMRFKPEDVKGNALINNLRNLLDPAKTLALQASKSEWSKLADSAVSQARTLCERRMGSNKESTKKILLSKENCVGYCFFT